MKYHLAANKGADRSLFAMCASRPSVNGRVRLNARASYADMSSPIVRLAEFRELPADQRCAHCMDIGLIRRNAQRKAKGKPPVSCLLG